MGAKGFARLGRSVALLVLCGLLNQCGGGSDCQECTTAAGCPTFVKTCPGYTATVSSCGGISGGKMCCATSADAVPCAALASTSGIFTLTAGLAVFTPSDSDRCLRYYINVKDNGWVTDGMTRQEQEVAVARKLAEINPGAALK